MAPADWSRPLRQRPAKAPCVRLFAQPLRVPQYVSANPGPSHDVPHARVRSALKDTPRPSQRGRQAKRQAASKDFGSEAASTGSLRLFRSNNRQLSGAFFQHWAIPSENAHRKELNK